MSDHEYGDKREYFRVKTQIRVGMRAVSAEELEGLAADIVHREPSPPGRIDPELAQWIGRIERKIDAMLVRLGAAPDADILPAQDELVVLSGNGMLVPAHGKTLAQGTTMLIELTLPEMPLRRIRTLCTVPRELSEEEGIPFLFACINESDRDAVIRHCLAVQRSEHRRVSATPKA
jgi:hypothetical protein